MSTTLRALLPDRISAQIALLLLLSLAGIHLFVATLVFWSRNELERRPPPGPAGEIAGVVRLLASVSATDRVQMLRHIQSAFPRIGATLSGDAISEQSLGDPHVDMLRRELGPQFRVAAPPPANSSLPRDRRIVIAFPDGDTLTVATPWDGRPFFFASPFFITLIFILLSITLLAIWAGHALIAPLRRFVGAADNFVPDASVAPLPEQGPFEIRAAAKALNTMRLRIKGLMEDRTRMLAAMGHDLRTPITRMRLRSEFIADSGLRIHMLQDLDQMRGMIDAALTYLRDGHSGEQETTLDLAILLQTLCEEFGDFGGELRYEGPPHLTMRGRPDDLRRAASNLMDNALRYAGKATVQLSSSPSGIRIDIEDDGPGIPHAQKDRMLEPFIRGDDARGMNESSGFGLGLSIANRIVAAHGGRLALLDREPHGLLVRIQFAQA